jgi:hypothetical protein
MRPFVISATIPYIAKTFAEQKLCSATMEPTHQLYMQPMWPNSVLTHNAAELLYQSYFGEF